MLVLSFSLSLFLLLVCLCRRLQSQYCLHHITAKFLQAGKGRQQLNSSMGSFRKSLFSGPGSQPKNISAGVYTSAAPVRSVAAATAAGWHVPGPSGGQKRKRSDGSGGFQGGPMRLSASGTVIQNASRPTAKALQQLPSALKPTAPQPQPSIGSADSEPKRATRGQKIMCVPCFSGVVAAARVADRISFGSAVSCVCANLN